MGTLDQTTRRLTYGALYIVPETTFDVAPSSGHVYLETMQAPEVSKLHRRTQAREAYRATLEDPHGNLVAPAGVIGDDATLDTKHYFVGYSDDLPDAAAITAAANASDGYPLAWILKAALGGQEVGAVGVTDDTETNTTVLNHVLENVDAVAPVGAGFYVDLGSAAAQYEGAVAQSVVTAPTADPEELTPRFALSSAPGLSKAVIGTVSSFATPELPDSYTFVWVGLADDEEGGSDPIKLTMSGCVPRQTKFEGGPEKYPTVAVTWSIASAVWDSADVDEMSNGDWDYGTPEMEMGDSLLLGPASDIRTGIDGTMASWSVTIDNALVTMPDSSQPHGKSFKLGARKITCDVRLPYTTDDVRDVLEGDEEMSFFYQHGAQPGQAVMIHIPSMRLQPGGVDGPSDQDGYGYASLTYEARVYADDTGVSFPAANRPIVVAF